MSEQIERAVLEVRSNQGRVLEGVFEVDERSAADRYVCELAAGNGVLAKVLHVPCAGVMARREAVVKAWIETPYPPRWFVVVSEQDPERKALTVHDWEEGAQAIDERLRLEGELGGKLDLRVHVHPVRPTVGRPYQEGI